MANPIWHRIAIETVPELEDAIGSYLFDQGALGLESEPTSDGVRVIVHLETPPQPTQLDSFFDALEDSFPGAPRPTVEISTLDESNWAESWKDHFPPLEIGYRLFVHPPWIEEIPEGRLGVELDPGMAFGTGHHASTKGCLQALDQHVNANKAPRLLDLGTGSGILAIAAIKLGATSALAVDIDPDACAVARENTRTNNVSEAIEVDTELPRNEENFDIVVANIFSGMLIGFANDITRRLVAGGIAIGSGLETVDADAVTDAWETAGLRQKERIEIDGWTTLVHEKA